MKHNIEYKHFEPKERVRKLIEDLIARLEKHQPEPGGRRNEVSKSY